MNIENQKTITIEDVYNVFIKYKPLIISKLRKSIGENVDYDDMFQKIIDNNIEMIIKKYDPEKGKTLHGFILDGLRWMIIHLKGDYLKAKRVNACSLSNLVFENKFDPAAKQRVNDYEMDKVCWAFHNVPKCYRQIAICLFYGNSLKILANKIGISRQRAYQIRDIILKFVREFNEKPPLCYSSTFNEDKIAQGVIVSECKLCGKKIEKDFPTNKAFCCDEHRATYRKIIKIKRKERRLK